jgi:purine-binding chemotaxis protein CheW
VAQAKELRLITFRLGSETFVIDIMSVRQIIPYAGSTAVPTAPRFVEGIIVVRNEVIPVIDLSERLFPNRLEMAAQPLVLITHSRAGAIGLKVDEVRRIINVSADSILPPPPIVRSVRGELLIGIIPYGEEVFLVMDLDGVLTVQEKKELQSVDLSSSSAPGGRSER